MAVVPGYYLVCYNSEVVDKKAVAAVVPGYYLVCYNGDFKMGKVLTLQFPVITWYVIIN